jgi:hypothetical protein
LLKPISRFHQTTETLRFPPLASNHAAQFICLRPTSKALQSSAMKFFLAILVYAAMAAILGAGILLVTHGNPWLLIIGAVAFVFAFGKLGCMTH